MAYPYHLYKERQAAREGIYSKTEMDDLFVVAERIVNDIYIPPVKYTVDIASEQHILKEDVPSTLDFEPVKSSEAYYCINDNMSNNNSWKLLDKSSSNEYYLCDNCGAEKRFNDKKLLQDHIENCDNKVKGINVPTRIKRKRRKAGSTILHFCPVCKKNYLHVHTLRYHIRRDHFNLISKTPYYQQKKVNQVWFEKVQNSDAVIEVHKTGLNSLVIRRLSKNTAIKVNEVNTNTIDLRYMYPTYSYKKFVKCDECDCSVYPHALLKHKMQHQCEKEKSSPDIK